MRLEVGLVAHLVRFGDPVTEVEIVKTQALGLADQPDDRQSTQAALRQVWFIKRINGGQAIVQFIDDAYCQQAAILPKLVEPALAPGGGEELQVLLWRWIGHLAADMPTGQLAAIQVEMFGLKAGRYGLKL